MNISVIGFGEAGQVFACGLAKAHNVLAFDIQTTPEMRRVAETHNVVLTESLESALDNAEIILSLVTADQARIVAKQVAPFISNGLYLEMNSVSPDTKAANAKHIPTLVDVAIMAPVHPEAMKVPLLLSHSKADSIIEHLTPLGLNIDIAGYEIGHTAAVKMCRSIMIKGLEALTVECLRSAYHYGVENQLLASLHKSFPEMGWDKDRADYWFERIARHGRRRAAEMREVAKTVSDSNIATEMALTTAKSHDNLIDEIEARDIKINFEDFTWKQLANQLKDKGA